MVDKFTVEYVYNRYPQIELFDNLGATLRIILSVMVSGLLISVNIFIPAPFFLRYQ